VVALGALAVRSAELQPKTVDDAYITFRYAENWVAGFGPVYNPGERVEGYTCFLWMALLAVGHALGAATPVLAKVLGALAAGGTLVLLGTMDRWLSGADGRAAAAAALSLGACGMFSGWALSGMEVALVGLLVMATWSAHWASHDRPGWAPAAGVFAALAAMTRPDAVLIVGAQTLEHLAQRRWRVAGRHGAGFSVVFVPFWLGRWAWYGWFFPNTFYAKVGATSAQAWRGLHYTVDFLWPAAPLLLPLLFLPLVSRRGRFAGAVGWLLLHAVYVVAVGGDGMAAFRFYVPMLGPLAALGGLGWMALGDRVRGAWLLVVPFAALSWTLAHRHPELSRRFERGNVGRNGAEVGQWMAENLPSDALLATNTAGSVPYYARLPTIDMLGLNDATIAHAVVPGMGSGKAGHEKADGNYVLSRRPDWIQLGSARGSQRPVFQSGRQLFGAPGFRRDYELQQFRLPSRRMLILWHRRDAPAARQAPLAGPPGSR